jgi:hypothetical protein
MPRLGVLVDAAAAGGGLLLHDLHVLLHNQCSII